MNVLVCQFSVLLYLPVRMSVNQLDNDARLALWSWIEANRRRRNGE